MKEDDDTIIFSINSLEMEKISKNTINNSVPDFDNNIRKIVIISEWIKVYLTLEPFTFAVNLQEYGWEIVELNNLDINYIKKEKTIVLCITYDGFDINDLKHENVTIIYKIDDLYPFKEIRNRCINSCDLLIGPYKYLFKNDITNKLYPNITNKPSYWIPYSAINNFYENIIFNDNTKNKILISGICDVNYPFRQKLHNISLENEYKDKIEKLVHVTYNGFNHNFIHGDYYKKLNEYICCFTDALTYNYILLKVFEITSVGSLLLVVDSISDELNKLGFYDNINCIMCNENNIYEKIDWILDKNNINIVNSIRKKGMELTRKNHSTKERAHNFNNLLLYKMTEKKENNLEVLEEKQIMNMERKQTFENIYTNKVWNNGDTNVPLSGPGSSLECTHEISNMLNEFIYNYNIKNILDLGCGDLTWISNTPFFKDNSIQYTGVDIVEFLVDKHKEKYPERKFYNGDIIHYNFNFSELIIIRDVTFHLRNNEILELFNNIKNKFKYIAITSSITNINSDNLNEYHFSLKNIHIEPFNIKQKFIKQIPEPIFNRFFYIYSHDDFFAL